MRAFSVLLASVLMIAEVGAAPRTVLPEDSQIEFTVKQMGVPLTGEFKRFAAVIDFDPAKPDTSSAELRIETGSLSMGNSEVDEVALGPEWLDQAHAPVALFKSTALRALGGGRYEAKGRLTIRNQTRDIVAHFDSRNADHGETLLLGEFTIHRSQFGIGGGVWNDSGVVAEDVPVKVRLALAPIASGRR